MELWQVAKAVALAMLIAGPVAAQISDNLLTNPSFEEPVGENGIPPGWSVYAGGGQDQAIRIVKPGDSGEQAALIEDGDPGTEIGLTQTVPVEPLLVYQASVRVKGVEGETGSGAYLQMRFLPSNKYFQTSLAWSSTEEFEEIAVKGVAPGDTERATIYLYTHRDPTPKVIVDSVALVSGVEPPPPPPPEPVPPVYTELKELYINTELVRDGGPNVTIIAPASGIYDDQTAAIQAAIKDITDVEVPIATDDSPEAEVPIKGNLIVIGNRSTNKTISKLYDLYYTLLDLRYPGPRGSVVRTLHNPFGDGRNVILVGGSDDLGVSAAAGVLEAKLSGGEREEGRLTIGRLMEIRLGEGIEVPTDIREFEVWEASKGYGSTGYFGWNSISKRMAMYYMTGDEFHAREAYRLAFPDDQAKQEISEIDGERIEDKDDPLKGPYHYNAHMMILFWDLIEESPVFTDEERLAITNGFSRQLNHRKGEGIYGRTQPPPYVGSRHGQWSAVSLYSLGRYFQKGYEDPIWAHCVEAAKLHFKPLHEHAWLAGESDNLFWYNTGIAPIFTYLVLTGDRVPVEKGVIGELLRGQEMLISGRQPDWALNSASMGFVHKAAYVTQDGRWLTYRDRTGVDLSIFRLGQSFWPDESLTPQPPDDLVGKWSINFLPKPMWRARNNGFRPDESFVFGSYRSATDETGDFTLIDGFNGASRNPYHTFAILELRLNGHTLLAGYRNQLLTRADGLVEPIVAMNAALRAHDVVGDTAYAVAEVPDAAYCNWRRTLVQRTGRFALVVDDLSFRTDADNMEVQTLWETRGGSWNAEEQALQIPAVGADGSSPGWTRIRALDSTYEGEPGGEEGIRRLSDIGIVLLRATEPGNWLEMTFRLPETATGEVYAEFVGYVDRGIVRILLDGKAVVPEYDHYAPTAAPDRVSLGEGELAAGEHKLRIEVVRRRGDGEKCYVGLNGLSVREQGAVPPDEITAYEIRAADVMAPKAGRGVHTLEWTGPAHQGESRVQFSLIAPRIEGQPAPACLRIAPNAATLALPEPALAAAGRFDGTDATLAVIARGYLFGTGVTEVSVGEALVRTDAPIDIEWDFESGTVHVVASEPAEVGLALASADGLTLNGQPLSVSAGKDRLYRAALETGRHVIQGGKISPEARQGLLARLAELSDQGRSARQQVLAEASAQPQPEAPPPTEALVASAGENVVDLITAPSPDGPVICAVEGQTVHLLNMQGDEIRALEADGPIRMVHWWPEHELLLAGCVDEQVIAFTLDGQRKWVFTSEMHPDVFRAAKTYWFKSAPGHEGIHGLHTGVFLDGKSQAFVGSACTLEIIDENGQLVNRLVQFWGKVSHYAIIDGPDGSLNLLASRKYNGTNTVAIINNQTVDPTPRGFYGVPAGHTYVGGWSSMNRRHLFYVDLDGDGLKEVVSEINGTWNRVTVWDAAGKALYDASFGPGDRIMAKNMRDLDIADLDGDGKQEILAATSGGLIVALNNECQKLWATRLPSPPTVMKVVRAADGTPWIVTGCESGQVVVLDGKGEMIRLGSVTGAPTVIAAEGTVALIATNKGEVKGFNVGE